MLQVIGCLDRQRVVSIKGALWKSGEAFEIGPLVGRKPEETIMTDQLIQEGFEVFVSDGDKPFGAVRQVKPHGRSELVVYVENAGDFAIPLGAIKAVHSQKVIVDCDKLDHILRRAIGHAHQAEDPNI
jgi:hypothetical protein